MESDEAVSERCVRLRQAMGHDLSVTFAVNFLGVSAQRWNNVERGLPLGRDLAMTVVRKVPGLSLDWLYRGRREGLPLELLERLGELPASRRTKTTPS